MKKNKKDLPDDNSEHEDKIPGRLDLEAHVPENISPGEAREILDFLGTENLSDNQPMTVRTRDDLKAITDLLLYSDLTLVDRLAHLRQYYYDLIDSLALVSETGGAGSDTNFALNDLTFGANRNHNLNGKTVSLKYNETNMFQMHPNYFQFWKAGLSAGAENVFALNLLTVAGHSFVTGLQSDLALIAYYLKASITCNADLVGTASIGSWIPTSDNAGTPAPPVLPNKTVIISAQQNSGEGLAYIYGKRVFIDCDELKLNYIRLNSKPGAVLTDVTGNGVIIPKIFQFPSLTTSEISGILTPVEGQQVYDRSLKKVRVYNATSWMVVARSDLGQTFDGNNVFSGFLTSNSGISSSIDTLQLLHNPNVSIGIAINPNAATTMIAGTRDIIKINENFFPTSGTAVSNFFTVSGTINQTGGANGVTRGIYVAPTLTAAANWRSFESYVNVGYGFFQSGAACKNYFGGATGFGTQTPHASALVEISSTTQGLRLPRMTKAQRNLITPVADGLLVYVTDGGYVSYFDGTMWYKLSSVLD